MQITTKLPVHRYECIVNRFFIIFTLIYTPFFPEDHDNDVWKIGEKVAAVLMPAAVDT